jgi:hypothetical protein
MDDGKTDFQTEIQGYEAVNAQVDITDLRWVVAHVPFITADYVARLQALGGGVNLTPYEYFNTSSPAGPPSTGPDPRRSPARLVPVRSSRLGPASSLDPARSRTLRSRHRA